MQTGRVAGISMSERHNDQIVPLEVNHVFGQFFGNHKMIGNLTGKKRIPERPGDCGDACWRITFTTSGVATRRAARKSL